MVVLIAALYVRLLFGPVSLNFLSDRVKHAVAGVVDDSFAVDWDGFGLTLTGPVSVGFHLSTVKLTERATDAVIEMDALEIGLSPLGLAIGRPEARVVLVEPKFQMLQNLIGPRLSRFEFIEQEGTGETLVRIMEGESQAPTVQIGDQGLSLGDRRGEEIGLRSDNDWLVLNLEALNQSLAQLSDQAMAGQVRRFEIRDGSVGVLDTVYGLYRSFDQVDLQVRSGRIDGRVAANFSAQIAGRVMEGEIVREIGDEGAKIDADFRNMDFSTLIPFLDDATGLVALRGAGGLGLHVQFDQAGEVDFGQFTVDISGTSLRLNDDLFTVSTEPFVVQWTPDEALFSIADVDIGIGQSRANIGGDFVMGFDDQFGPTLGMSIRASDVWLHPDDLEAPTEPFEEFHFEGWSAPLYGAIGIDRMVGAKDGVSIVLQGRVDMVREGVGFDLRLSGRGASADDIKRIWPYLFAPEGRELFTTYVGDGTVRTADMHFKFPVGSVALDGEQRPMPEGAMRIDMVGEGLQLLPMEGLPEFQVEGESRLTMRDTQLTLAFERARVPEFGSQVAITNAAFINQDVSADEQIFEISADVSGSVPGILSIAASQTLNLLEDFDFGVDLADLADDLTGQVQSTVIATIATDQTGQLARTDYALNGSVTGLASREPLEGISFDSGDFGFTASQLGYRIAGSAKIGESSVQIEASKSGQAAPEISVGSTLNVADAATFGVDLSDYMSGTLRLVGRPREDGRIELLADITDTALDIRDVGVTKERGTAGEIEAVVTFEGETIEVSDVSMGFGSVKLEGEMSLSSTGDLMAANFGTFQVSPGDSAQVHMELIDGGYAVSISGQQLDLKPVLRRFFNLGGDASAGPSDGLSDQIFNVRVNLDRALGHYGAAAFNLDLDLSLRGDQLRRVNLATQFSGGRAASATTNPLPTGRLISYATNDLGEMLRFVGIYPRLVGGEGSMVMRYDEASQADAGEFVIRDFAIVDEANLAAIVGSHDQSRAAIGGVSAVEFDYGRAEFVRFPDRIEVVEAAIYGDTVGGTIRGNVLTQAGRYDLAGTYVPLFGINNVFQQIPILGPIFGGREGEGLIGVTFAVRGPLAAPDLLINPVSILAPGVFRTLFEYRAANQRR